MSEFVNTIDVIGDDALTDSIIDRSIVEYRDNIITSIGNHVFQECTSLTTADFPSVTSIGNYAFYGCTSLTTADFPAATSVGDYTFCRCKQLTTIDFPSATSVGTFAFYNCTSLTTLILRNTEKVATLSSMNSVNNTPIKSGTGYIYVPAALVDSYKSATNWSTYAAQFRALEDYTVDGTTTGELDSTKI